eukprot:Gb_11920 [translate_table: standard]
MGRIKPQTLLLQSKKKKGPARISVSTIVVCNLIIVFLMLSLVAIYRQRAKRTMNQSRSASGTFEVSHEMENFEVTGTTNIPHQAILNTTKGIITVQLFGKNSARTVAKFVERSQRGYFNGLSFHRVIKHFVIQGGDPKLAGSREDWTVGGQLNGQLEFSPKHEAFMLATSKVVDQGNGFELFITTAPIPDLNDKLTVFGRVIKGEDVVQEIEEVDTDEHFRPKSPIIINDVTFKDEL